MNEQVPDYFTHDHPGQHFNKIISLHEAKDLNWENLSQKMPLLPRGWFELARLPAEDRIEFTREYWHAKLLYMDRDAIHLEKHLNHFFGNIEEIGIFATQGKSGGRFDVHMVYSLKDEGGYFQGFPPASEGALDELKKRFAHIDFPTDYLAFLQIHDGFSKYTDTGLIKSREMAQTYQKLQHLLAKEVLVRPDGSMIDPAHLIPFYESFGLHNYQCFYADWYPKKEMGNVYFSEQERSISDFFDGDDALDSLAFPSFLGWLIFYLEDIWHL